MAQVTETKHYLVCDTPNCRTRVHLVTSGEDAAVLLRKRKWELKWDGYSKDTCPECVAKHQKGEQV